MTIHWQAAGIVAALGAVLAARKMPESRLHLVLSEMDRSDLPHLIFARDLDALAEADGEARSMLIDASHAFSHIEIVRDHERIAVAVPRYRIITSAALANIVETLSEGRGAAGKADISLLSRSQAGETWFDREAPVDALTFIYLSDGNRWTEALVLPQQKGALVISDALSKAGRDALKRVLGPLRERSLPADTRAGADGSIMVGEGTGAPVVDAPRVTMIDRALTVRNMLPSGEPASVQAEIARLEKAAQHAENNVRQWIAGVRRYMDFDIDRFAYALLTRSQRVGHAQVSPDLSKRIQRRLSGDDAVPPMFAPFALRNLVLPNRVAVSPMCTYSAVDGEVDDFHLVHLGTRAQGGAGLVFTEMTAVSPEARITPNCAGIYTDAAAEKWARIVDFVHRNSDSKIALQLGHAGRKGATRPPWEGADVPAPDPWPLVAASALPWTPQNAVPDALTPDGMAIIIDQFVGAARRAADAGFDMIELHFAHGYLLSSFISPLTNLRTDTYGGSIEGRMRFPIEVLTAVRTAWGLERPISVRISACDWAEGGLTPTDALIAATLLRTGGADLISVSTGQTTPEARPRYGQLYQLPFSDVIRNEVGIPTLAVGAITEPDQVNAIVAAGRADLCALARTHLVDPYWTLRSAAAQTFSGTSWPPPYRSGEALLNRRRAA